MIFGKMLQNFKLNQDFSEFFKKSPVLHDSKFGVCFTQKYEYGFETIENSITKSKKRQSGDP